MPPRHDTRTSDACSRAWRASATRSDRNIVCSGRTPLPENAGVSTRAIPAKPTCSAVPPGDSSVPGLPGPPGPPGPSRPNSLIITSAASCGSGSELIRPSLRQHPAERVGQGEPGHGRTGRRRGGSRQASMGEGCQSHMPVNVLCLNQRLSVQMPSSGKQPLGTRLWALSPGMAGWRFIKGSSAGPGTVAA